MTELGLERLPERRKAIWLIAVSTLLLVIGSGYLDDRFFGYSNTPVIPISLHTGFTFLLLLLNGVRVFPWVFLGEVVVGYLFHGVETRSVGLVTSIILAAGEMLGYSVAIYLLRFVWIGDGEDKQSGFEQQLFGKLKGVFAFLFCGGLLMPMIAMLVYPIAERFSHSDLYEPVRGYWVLFVMRRALSVVGLLPIGLTLYYGNREKAPLDTHLRFRIMLFGFSLCASVFVFCDTVPSHFAPRLIQAYWFLPFVVLAPLFLKPAELFVSLVASLFIASIGTYYHAGVFGGLDPVLSQLHLSSFLLAVNAICLMVGASGRERKKAEDRLKAQIQAVTEAQERSVSLAARLRSVIDTAADAIVGVDDTGLIVEWNPQAERMFGWSKGEVIGTPITETLFSQEFYDGVLGEFKGAEPTLQFPQEPKARGEVSLPTSTGKRVPVELVVCSGATGKNNFTLFAQDISERRSRQQLVVLQTERLAKANENLQRVVQAVAHDVRSPLNTIANFLQLLLRRHRNELSQEAVSYVEAASEGASQLGARIAKLLDAKPSSTGATVGMEAVDLNRVFDNVLRDVRAEIEQSQAVITRDRMPSVLGIEAQLHIVFQNLIANALKYAKPRTIPRIHIAAQLNEDHWIISVSDNGVGIVEKDKEKVFKLFARGETVGAIPGEGIGLATVRAHIEEMGGEVWYESTPGLGSTFYCALPKHEANGKGNTETVQMVSMDGQPRDFEVLIIDDSATDADLLKHIFLSTESNVHVTAIQDAGEALDYLGGVTRGRIQKLPHLIILDLHLPIRSGIEVLKEIRAHRETFAIPVVMLSGSERESDIFTAYEAGASGYIVKPGTLDEFEKVVRTICEYWLSMVRYPSPLNRSETGMGERTAAAPPEPHALH